MFSKRFLSLFSTLIFSILFFSAFFLSCKEKTPQLSDEEQLVEFQKQEQQRLEQEKLIREQKIDSAIQKYIDSFSDEVKVSQLFLVNIEGNSKFVPIEKTADGKPLVPGGCLMFSYNISDSPKNTFNFIKSISDFYVANENIPPYIAIDQEGGDVNRLRGMTSVLWSQKKVSERFSVENAKKLYSEQAKQMHLLGINMNLAPVVEVENSQNSEFLGTRTFGSLEKTLSYGKSEIEGFEENEIATVLKHFPGNSSTDPHFGLPIITIETTSTLKNYLKSFEELLSSSSAVLMSHAKVLSKSPNDLIPNEPACLSSYWINYLRENFNFKGLIISDDIFMVALAKNGYPPEVAVIEAINAGVNIIMLSEKKFGSVAKILLDKMKEDSAFNKKISDSVRRIVDYKIKSGLLELKENMDTDFEVRIVTKGEFDDESFKSAKAAGMKLYE